MQFRQRRKGVSYPTDPLVDLGPFPTDPTRIDPASDFLIAKQRGRDSFNTELISFPAQFVEEDDVIGNQSS